jgi:hypothetical protein
MEGPDESFADGDLEVLERGVAGHVGQLVHQRVAELEQGIFRRMGTRVLELESLGFVGGETFV